MGAANAIDASSLDDFTNKIIANGGEVVLAKEPVPGVCYVACWQDTEGNTFANKLLYSPRNVNSSPDKVNDYISFTDGRIN